MYINNKIKTLRKSLRLSQLKFAELVKLSPATIASWEIGRRRPKIKQILKIGERMGCTSEIVMEFILNYCSNINVEQFKKNKD